MSYTEILINLGFAVFVGVVLIFLFRSIINKLINNIIDQQKVFTDKIDKLSESLEKISKNIGRKYFNENETMIFINSIFGEHKLKKIMFIINILITNNIKNRKDQIKKNIKNEFEQITEGEATKLSQFNSPVGDLGKFLLDVDFNKFLEETFEVVFSDSNVLKKIDDFKLLMDSYTNQITRKIKIKMQENIFV